MIRLSIAEPDRRTISSVALNLRRLARSAFSI